MRSLAKVSLLLFTASWVLLASLARGAYNGDIDYSTFQISPTNRGGACLGSSCVPPINYATQSYDCNRAGYGTPRPIGNPRPNVNFLDLGALRREFFRNPDPSATDLNNDGVVNPVDLQIFRDTFFGQPPKPSDGRVPVAGASARTAAGAGQAARAAGSGGGGGSPIIVTGSRIPSLDLESVTPIQVVSDATDPESNLVKFFVNSGLFGGDTLPQPGVPQNHADYGADADPLFGNFGMSGPYSTQGGLDFGGVIRANEYDSLNVEIPSGAGGLQVPGLDPYLKGQQTFGGRTFGTLKFDPDLRPQIEQQLQVTGIRIIVIETNWCRIVLVPTDPSYTRTGRHDGNSWGARMDDQWAIKRVGFTDDEDSAWNQVPDTAADVVVAVIDTGLDWHHRDISPQNIWRNPREIPDNNIDDDNNGYVDDIIGWNFLGRNNKPWDHDGHGTVVAGVIAAAQNDTGIAGINPHARIMVLKGVNNFGTTRASFLAEAIKYAADNGAKIINISVGGPHETEIEKAAIAYANSKGVLIIAASGNEGVELDDFGPGGNDHVLTVGATHTDDRVGGFSNFGDGVDLVAPGVDVLSLRARFTDVNYRPASGEEYEIGSRYVGEDKRYIHVSGTSFSTPIVTGVASLILAKHPQLTAAEVERLLLETAEDIEFPGKDKYAGYGMVDARAALSVEPDFFITAEISGLEFVQTEDKDQIHVLGSIGAGAFKRAWVQIGAGENPAVFKAVGQKRKLPIDNGVLSTIDLSEFAGSELWQVVVNVEHRNGVVKRVVRPLRIK